MNSSKTPDIRPSLWRLFTYTRELVTPDDIRTYAPSDPGYDGYVSAWTKLLDGEEFRRRSFGNYSEVINLTNYSHAEFQASPERFCRFRTWTCSVGLLLIAEANRSFPPNYSLLRLLQDQAELNDHELRDLLIPAIEELHTSLRVLPWEPEFPFCTLTVLLIRLARGERPDALVEISRLLIEEEDAVRKQFGERPPPFLLGLTHFNLMYDDWREIVAQIVPADVSVEELALIREGILASPVQD